MKFHAKDFWVMISGATEDRHIPYAECGIFSCCWANDIHHFKELMVEYAKKYHPNYIEVCWDIVKIEEEVGDERHLR
jgi:hypothetical protein